jgi:hypothetical protein
MATAATLSENAPTQPSSFCSMATANCANELIGLLLSLSVHHPTTPVVCLVDTPTKEQIESLSAPLRCPLLLHTVLDPYNGKDRKQMEREGVWVDFQMMKSRAIDIALESYADTMFLDSDIFLFNPIQCIDSSKQIGVSPHYIRKRDTDKFGYYNGGALWTRDKTVPAAWREFTKTSRFYDQASIEDLARTYSFFEFPEQCNVSWWRIVQAEESIESMIKCIGVSGNQVLYKKKPICFVHTHFYPNTTDPSLLIFNNLIIASLTRARRYKELTILGRTMWGKWRIHSPKQPMPAPWNHTNDSFREELILLYKKNKDVEIIADETHNLVLEPAVMLYDRDTINWFVPTEMGSIAKVYLGNCNMEEDATIVRQAGFEVSPWIYWPRRPIFVEHLLGKGVGSKGFTERGIESLFIGNFENAVQQQFRTTADWGSFVQEFHLTGGTKHKFTPPQYLEKLAEARFGLCLRGYGVKCHREVELMAFGTVPIVTPHVNTTAYQEPLVEAVHYVRANTPEEIPRVLAAVTPEQWTTMSANCKAWYMRNVHSDNMWRTFMGRLLYNE